MRQLTVATAAGFGGGDLDLYAAIVDALDMPGFGATVLRSLATLAGVEEILAFTRSGDAPPAILLSAGRGDTVKTRVAAYRDRHFRWDPLNGMLEASHDPGTVALRVTRDDIADRQYRRDCYAGPGFDEKLSLINFSRAGSLVLSVFRRGGFTPRDAERLSSFGELLFPLIRAQARAMQASPAASIEVIEARLAARHPDLTARERAVCARTAIGMTAEGIALALGIRPTSVLTYRRRAYARLKLSSALQLVARFCH